MPAARPVASEEHETLGIATAIFDEKFVQPLNWRYERGWPVRLSLYFVTEFTTITCGSLEGQLWCWAASSAAEAITATSRSYAYSTASRARLVWFRVPSASCTTWTSLSTAYRTACAKSLSSAMNESPTRMWIDMQFGQVPSSPPLFASAVESRASPVPWPYWTSSNGSLSSSRKYQPTTSSTKPFESSSTPSLNAISTSCGSSSGRPSATAPSPSAGAGSTRESQA